MKPLYLFFLFLTCIFLGCSREDGPEEENFLRNETFVHLFYQSEEECLEAQPDPAFFINCHQQLDFLDDNKVNLMLTDIIWSGEYTVVNGSIVLTFEPGSEIPDGEIIFEIINQNVLLKTDDDSIWKKMTGDSIWE